MSNLGIDQSSTGSYCRYLERCLQHSNVDVKVLGLNDIERRLKETGGTSSPSSINYLTESNIVIALLNCLECEETRVATITIRVLLKLLPKAIEDKVIKDRFEQILCGKDLVRCRVYEIGVKLSQLSAISHEQIEFILEKLVNDLDTEDILLQLNVLDLVADLALTDYGHTYLENKDVFSKVLRQIEQLDDNPFKSILVPGYLKFFGHIATAQPTKIIQGFPNMINSLFDCILDGNTSVLPVAFDTLGKSIVFEFAIEIRLITLFLNHIGHLGRTHDGKLLLNELHSGKLAETLNDIGKSIHNFPTPLQTRALNCLETLFQCEPSQLMNNQINQMTEYWFGCLTGTNQLTFVQDFCRNPFPEIKIAALALLRSICGYRWGQRALSETAGFIEYLLDRNSEFDKDAIHEKYNVIKALGESNVFDASTILQIRQYIKDGAFYVQGIMEVAVENN